MMAIPWEQEWDNSLEGIRESHHIPTYNSIFPADLIEAVTEAPLLKKLKLGYQIVRFNRLLKRGAPQPAFT